MIAQRKERSKQLSSTIKTINFFSDAYCSELDQPFKSKIKFGKTNKQTKKHDAELTIELSNLFSLNTKSYK